MHVNMYSNINVKILVNMHVNVFVNLGENIHVNMHINILIGKPNLHMLHSFSQYVCKHASKHFVNIHVNMLVYR